MSILRGVLRVTLLFAIDVVSIGVLAATTHYVLEAVL